MTTATAMPLVLGALLAAACAELNIPDFNNPAIDDLQKNPTRTTVLDATQGLFIGARQNIAAFNGYIATLGVLGRESYNFDPGDPRFITELLGGPLDGGSPRFGGNLWNERYTSIRNANIVLNALDVLGGPPIGMTATEKEGVRGVAKTLQALDFLLVIDTRDTLGAPIDVNRDVITGGLGPFVSRTAVFAHIVQLLDAAVTHLKAAGPAFAFSLPEGFTGFTTPIAFIKVNRALKARVEAYRASLLACGAPCWTDAISALDSSFLALPADTSLKVATDPVATAAMLARGAYYDFGSGSGDLANALSDPTGSKQRGHPSLKMQAETQLSGSRDQRFRDKVDTTVTVATRIGHSSDMAFKIYGSSAAPIPIIRNEELILLRAEAELGLSNQAAAAALINYIRVNSGRLQPRAGLDVAPTADVITELLQQRLYSLLFEGGHRWIDARRYGRLPSLPNPVATDQIFRVMPIPTDECSARTLPANCTPLTP
jgi:starch-binding outer membrane protein, SusD/RagB family